jgi:hypothetical protein
MCICNVMFNVHFPICSFVLLAVVGDHVLWRVSILYQQRLVEHHNLIL